MSKGWDNAMLKKLKALTGKGLSTSEIGKRLGMSKNAVVGKLNRLGWNLKAAAEPVTKTVVKSAPKKAVAAAAPKKAPSVKKAPAAKKAATVTTSKTSVGTQKDEQLTQSKKSEGTKSLNKTLAMHQRIVQHSLEMANLKPNQCRWPIGDPDSEDFHFCGAAVFVGKPYCYEHCKQAYQFTQKK